MRAYFPLLVIVLVAAVPFGCGTPGQQSLYEPPAIVIDQLPADPIPGHDSSFPGGLVVAFWRDGRLIRCTDLKAVGKSYEEGTVTSQQKEEFFRFLDAAVVRASKVDGIPLHVATQSITIRSEGGTSHWTRLLPDSESVWREVESRLFQLSLRHKHAVEAGFAEGLIREK